MMKQLGNSSWAFVTVDTPAHLANAVEVLENAGNVVIDVVPLYGRAGTAGSVGVVASVLTGALIRCASDVRLPSVDKDATNRR